jgi:small-conductance mechanosensitive channel
MPNDSILVKKAMMQRDLLGKSFFDKKKKDLAEADEFIKTVKDKDDIANAKRHRDTVANRAYHKPEIDARVRMAAMKMKKGNL